MTPTDAELVNRANDGQEQALVQLYQRYLSPIYRYCYCQCGHRPSAEDLASDIFLKMVRQLSSFRGDASFKNWLYAIAKHTIADYWRKEYKTPTQLMDPDDMDRLTGGQQAETVEEIDGLNQTDEQQVKKILDSLPANYRQVLQCRFLDCQSIVETATTLNETEANVKVLQHRALKKAQELFQSYERI